MNGILVIDKPAGLTSAEVVRRVKARIGGKVGHLGTLDPFATGVLPLCLGEGTKIAQFLNTSDKAYEGLIRLGTATDTGDRTGVAVRTAPVPEPSESELEEVSRRFTGTIQQVPPMYSAIKRDGVPLYRLARRGIEVERDARSVRIASLRLEPRAPDRLWFAVSCSKGTYVRVLAEDIGAALGSAAHLEELRRTDFGALDLRRAVELDAWDPSAPAGMVTISEALAHLPVVRLSPAAANAAGEGRSWVLAQIEIAEQAVAVLRDESDEVVAVIAREDGRWTYARVLRPRTALQPDRPVLVNDSK